MYATLYPIDVHILNLQIIHIRAHLTKGHPKDPSQITEIIWSRMTLIDICPFTLKPIRAWHPAYNPR